jgi:hypothetical protein
VNKALADKQYWGNSEMNKTVMKTAILFLLLFVQFELSGEHVDWELIDDGLYIGEFESPQKSLIGDSKILIIKIDPNFYSFRLLCAGELKHSILTVKEWTQKYNLIGAINAGMFLTDYVSNVGFMKNYNYENNPSINSKYFSVAAFNPKDSTYSEQFQIFDIDEESIDKINSKYNTVIQNLRLVKHPSLNRWSQQNKKWSEAALGQDTFGNVLFIFVRSPYSMHDLINILKSLPINIDRAQHLEGGPEASLYFSLNNLTIDKMGSFETAFSENDNNNSFWPVPNVIGFYKK